MTIASRIRAKIADHQSNDVVTGKWRTVSLCLDPDAGEFLNVGVVFSYNDAIEVRMLDSFDRIKCFYDTRIDANDLSRLLHDIESTIHEIGPDLPDSLDSSVRLSEPLYASGVNAANVVDMFFKDVITLARPKPGAKEYEFRYQSTPRLRQVIFELMKERMHMQASRIIQNSRYDLRLVTGHSIEIDVPLMSSTSSGTIVSAWYKSPLVVENNLLQASADLNLIRTNTERREAVLSVLVPNRDSGLTGSEFTKLESATRRQIDRIKATGIRVLEASTTPDLADQTIAWWRERTA